MDANKLKNVVASGLLFTILFLAIASFALWLTMPSQDSPPGYTPMQEFAAYQNPNDMTNIAQFIITLLVMTGLILLALKYGFGRFIRYLLIFVVFIALLTTITMVLMRLGLAESDTAGLLGLVACFAATGYIAVRPFGIFANVVNFIAAAGITAIMGLSLGVAPILALLIALAIYDAIAVYKTKHMVTLAQGAIRSKFPAVMFTNGAEPENIDFSKPRSERGGGVAMIGLGDFIIPTLLVISSNVWIRAPLVYGLSIPSIGAMVGAIIGYFALSLIAAKYDTPHAGLPPLNGCIIACFLIACVITGSFTWI